MGRFLAGVPRNVRVSIAILVPLLLLAGGGYAALHHSPTPGKTQALNPTASPSDTLSPTASDASTPDAGTSPVAAVTPTPASSQGANVSPTAAATTAPSATHPPTANPTAATAPTATPTPAAPVSDCTSGSVTNKITTDKATYPSGTPVYVTVTLINHGTAACHYYPSADNPNICINQGNTEIWYRGYSCQGLPNTGGPGPATLLKAGSSYAMVITWNQDRRYPAGAAPRGSYTIYGGWGEGNPVTSAAFTLT